MSKHASLPSDWDDDDVMYWDLIGEEITYVAERLQLSREVAAQIVLLSYQKNALSALTEAMLEAEEELEPWQRSEEEDDDDPVG
jgi:hypothetical protein